MTTIFTVSDYLLHRMKELGIDKLFGVPGDYNLGFIDHVLANADVDWVGCANELNASYAADGYARLKGFGALATTYGVGELSALNGLAGARAEEVPVLEIVGAPSTSAIHAATAVHHMFGDGDFERFLRMGDEVTAASAFLTASGPTEEIDRVLRVMLNERLPVQLTIPSDVALLPAEVPTRDLIADSQNPDDDELNRFRATLRDALTRSRSLALLVGHEPSRLGLTGAVRHFAETTQTPSAFLHRGKGVLNEVGASFLGLFAGELSADVTRHTVENADLVIVLGALFQGGVVPFTSSLETERVLELGKDRAVLFGETFGTPMRIALEEVQKAVVARGLPSTERQKSAPDQSVELSDGASPLSQESFWSLLSQQLRPGHTVSAEAGTSYYALLQSSLPEDTTVVSQGMWSSIGFTFPAVLGAQLAAPERRAVLVIGDGSLQLTAQEFGTFQRAGATPIIIVVNNNGYTVERAIHGATAVYNDIATWDWQTVPAALGASRALTFRAETEAQLTRALGDAEEAEGCLVVIEVILPELDAPDLLLQVAEAVSRRNGYGE